MKYISIILVGIIVVMGVVLFNKSQPLNLGNVAIGGECHATTTDSTWNTTNMKMLKSSSGTLCSVIVTGATAGSVFYIMNATSTTDISSTTKATFTATATSGSYPFNMIMTRGIAVRTASGNAASTTITYR